jgi:hypothetical protein
LSPSSILDILYLMPRPISIGTLHLRKSFWITITASILVFWCAVCNAQTKFYGVIGLADLYYHNSANSGMPTISGNLYYGVEVDRYLDYHYAFTTGALYMKGGYDNGASRWTNSFIQVPLGIKMASLGDQIGIHAGINLNFLLNSELREQADPQHNYYTVDVTSAMQKIQPDFYFGLLFRLNRITMQFKYCFALTNRYSTGVKAITDTIPKYYASFYADELGKEEAKLTCWTTIFTLSYRVF